MTTATPSALIPAFARQPIAFTHGKGAYLYTEDGQAYFDALSGIAVCGLGHSHPAITAAIADQAATVIHTSNLFVVPWQEKAGALLCQVGGMEQCFFANSGAEANEAAIKLARLYGNKKGLASPKIIVMENSFHGRTMATLSATGNAKVQAGFSPLVEGFIRVPFGDVNAIKQLISQHDDIVAILVEPIQGEGGVNTAPQGFSYLTELREICDAQHWLLMLDEIQTGNGRTGTYFAYQHTTITPDVLTTAKGLGNGFPVGACLVSKAGVDVFAPGNHGTTFGGSPLACRTVYTVISTLYSEKAIENAAHMGAYLKAQFTEKLADLPISVRGFGMMIGIQLPMACGALVAIARDEHKVIINVTADKVVRLLPPLNLSQAQCDDLVNRLVPMIRHFVQSAS